MGWQEAIGDLALKKLHEEIKGFGLQRAVYEKLYPGDFKKYQEIYLELGKCRDPDERFRLIAELNQNDFYNEMIRPLEIDEFVDSLKIAVLKAEKRQRFSRS